LDGARDSHERFQEEHGERLQELNSQNRAFWDAQSPLLPQRLDDELVRACVLNMLRIEQARLPVDGQNSLDELAEQVATVKRMFLSEQGRKGGSAKKTDALQQRIIEIVSTRPTITEKQLREMLQARTWHDSVIEGVEDGKIIFCARIGSREFLDEAPVAGLKDRLSRAKKFLRSR
jgi:hypothetical protein